MAMTEQEAIGVLLYAKSGRSDYEAFDKAIEAFTKLNMIREITARALRSSDPINYYKAQSLKDIAKICGLKIEDPADNSNNQITIDEII